MIKDKAGLILEQILLFGKWLDTSSDVAHYEYEIALTSHDDVVCIKREIAYNYDKISDVLAVVIQNIIKIERGETNDETK